MNKKEYIQNLKELNPCPEALEWSIKTEYETAEEAWRVCERPDWMIWLINNSELTHGTNQRKMILCICDFLELVKHLMPESSQEVLYGLRKWANGDSLDLAALRKKATYAAAAAYAAADAAAYAAADAAAAAAAYADAAAAYAAYADAAAADAAYAAADAAAAYAAADAAAAYAAYAKPKIRIKICNIVRSHYPDNPITIRKGC